jgi:hypothetical protein
VRGSAGRAPELAIEGCHIELEKGCILMQEADQVKGIGEKVIIVGFKHLHQPDWDLAPVRGLLHR